MLCWHWWELSTAAAFGWAGSMPPLANRSPSGQSSKLPHPAGSFRKRGHGWVPERGLNRETEAWAESRDRGRKKEEDKIFPGPREEHRIQAHLSSILPCSMLRHFLSLPPASNNRARFFTVFAEARLHGRNIATETDPQGLPDPLPLSDKCAEL